MVNAMLNSLFQGFNRIVLLDVETTGLDCRRDEIIEIAAQRIVAEAGTYRVEYELNALVQLSEGQSLPNEITRLTGITEQMLLEDGDTKDNVCKKMVEILDNPNTLIAAYNAQFDLCFLYFFLLSHNCADVLRQIKMLDVMTIFKDRRDYPHKLGDAINAYSLENHNSHRAISDAKATLSILVAMEQEKDDLNKYINLFGYNPKYGISGPRISSVTYLPQGYYGKGKLYEQTVRS